MARPTSGPGSWRSSVTEWCCSKWGFSEAAVLFLAKCSEGKKLLARIERKHGKAKALSILAHKLGWAVYFMLARKQAFDLERFFEPPPIWWTP